jgi:hypothetical protein
LDNFQVWDFWDNGLINQEETEISRLSFEKKVYYMAKSKGIKEFYLFWRASR